jgi:hypothetical protein
MARRRAFDERARHRRGLYRNRADGRRQVRTR